MDARSPKIQSQYLRLIAKSETATVYHGSFYGAELSGCDMLAADPPWRQGNLSYWSHRAGTEQRWETFKRQMAQLFAGRECVYLKIGVPELPEWKEILHRGGFSHIHSWHTTYYAGNNAQLVGTISAPISCDTPLKSVDATLAVAEWSLRQGWRTVCDPCVGLGKMAKKFLTTGFSVAGIELCEDRALQAAKRLCQ